MNTTFPLVGTQVTATTMDETLQFMEDRIRTQQQAHICCCTVNMLMRSRADPELAAAVDAAEMVVPDGIPLVRIGNRRSGRAVGRVRAADLVHAFTELSVREEYTAFVYGGAPDVPQRMIDVLQAMHPGAEFAGGHSPPFRPLSEEEDGREIDMINDAAPDVVWVGLGCPKQEKWMLAHRGRIKAPVMVGVGAAFDFIAGSKREVPPPLQENFEWLWRFGQEPTRLWRRVLVEGPQFVTLAAIEEAGRAADRVVRRPRKPEKR